MCKCSFMSIVSESMIVDRIISGQEYCYYVFSADGGVSHIQGYMASPIFTQSSHCIAQSPFLNLRRRSMFRSSQPKTAPTLSKRQRQSSRCKQVMLAAILTTVGSFTWSVERCNLRLEVAGCTLQTSVRIPSC